MLSSTAVVGALAQTTTKSLLSNLGEMKWLDKTVSVISGLGKATDAPTNDEEAFRMQGYHPFYEDLIPDGSPCLVSTSG